MDANMQESSIHSKSNIVNGSAKENHVTQHENAKKGLKSVEFNHHSFHHDEFERQIEESLENIDAHVVNDSDSDFEDNHFSDWSRHSKIKSQFSSPENLSEDELSGSNSIIPTTPEALNINITYQPILPFIGMRRLSECKEEDEEDHHQSTSPKNNNLTTKEVAGTTRKFIVTKTQQNVPEVVITEPRPEAKNLQNMTARMNSRTIHFPCSTPSRAAIQNIFSPMSNKLTPHLDRKYFDSSMVEIRQSTKSLDKTDGDDGSGENSSDRIAPDIKPALDDIWIKRSDPNVKTVSYCI